VQWRSQPKKFGGGKMFDFRRIVLFCLEKRLSKHKMTIFSKNFGGPWPFWRPPGYAYGFVEVLQPRPTNIYKLKSIMFSTAARTVMTYDISLSTIPV